MEVDKKFEDIYFDENIIKQLEKLPNKVKLSLEKSKNIESNINKSALFLNECIKIEKNISDINKIDDVVKKCQNSIKQEIKLDTNEQINLLIEKIKIFGKIYVMNKFFFWYINN